MKRLLALCVASLAFAAPAANAQRQRTSTPIELGVDGGILFGLDAPRTTVVALPIQSFRVGFLVTDNLAFEPRAAINSIHGNGASVTTYDFQMGVVYHSNHLVWFEIGRVELMRQLGFSYRDMERDDGCFIAVAEVKCRYRAPVRYDEEVVVRTRLKGVRESVVQFTYELVRAENGALLAEGETTHIVTDANMKVAALPEKYLKVFREVLRKEVQK